MVVGFVNSGMMTLQQAVWIIMGANIGTTITAQLITLDVGMLAPLLAFLGVAMIVFFKAPKLHHFGKILAGFGVLFIGMDMMGAAMEPLQESEAFISLMTTFSNPFLGILAGAVFTAVIQSSSASVGILQALAKNGLIPFSSAVFVLFGQNIGTCITAVLAAIGTNRSAKRTTVIHLMFNVIGTLIFTLLCLNLPVTDWVGGLTPGDPSAQIANMHTTFNIVTTILLVPFGTYMAKLATVLLPDGKEPSSATALHSITEEYRRGSTTLGSNAVHLDLLQHEIDRMLALAEENAHRSYEAVLRGDTGALKALDQTESTIDAMNKEISQYISHILVHNNSDQIVSAIKEYFQITGNAERIGDHAANIGGYVETMERLSVKFSDTAREELRQMQELTRQALQLVQNREGGPEQWLRAMEALEDRFDEMTEDYRRKHLERMHRGQCSGATRSLVKS